MSASDNTTSKNSISLKEGIRSIFKNCAAPFKKAYNTYIEENGIDTIAIASNTFLAVLITLGTVIGKNSEAYTAASIITTAGMMTGLFIWGFGQRHAERKHDPDMPVRFYNRYHSNWKSLHDNRLKEIVEKYHRDRDYNTAQEKIAKDTKRALVAGVGLNATITGLLSYTIL